MHKGPSTLAHMVLGQAGYLDRFRVRPAVDIAAILAGRGLEWVRRPFKALVGALLMSDTVALVLTNSLLPLADQRLAAAHELGHYLMHRGQARLFLCRAGGPLDCSERQAAAFARELLMPTEIVWWLWRRGFRDPEQIGHILGVSTETAAGGIGGGAFNP